MFEYHDVDYLGLDADLSEDERLVRRTARDFVTDRVLPGIVGHFRDATFPRELVPEMGELGFFGASLEGYGCAGMSEIEYGLLMQELERGDSGLRSFVSVQSSLVMWPILTFGSDEQKERWLPALAKGEAIGCFGLTEPAFGSNPGGMLTKAVDDGDSYVLNGDKTWITNGTVADFAIVWAKLDGKVHGFLVEQGTPGFTSTALKGKLSMRASVTASLGLSDCRIPKSNLMPGAVGLKAALGCLNQARYGIGWGVIGAAEACFDTARQYVCLRKQFEGKPLAAHQLVQDDLAWMVTEITKAQLLARRVGALKGAGKLHHSHVSMLKRNNVGIALEVARRARDLLGANGIMDEYPVFRHMANLETVKTYEGTDNIHALVIGERVTGIPAYV